MWATAAIPHPGLRQRSEPQSHLRPGGRALGALHHAPDRISTSTAPIPIPTTTIRRSSRSPAKFTRWSWTARSSASSARREETGRVRHCPRNRLPQRGRTAGQRDHCLARTETHPAPREAPVRFPAQLAATLLAIPCCLPAQTSVPAIAFDSAPDLLKLPERSLSEKRPESPPTPEATFSSTHAPAGSMPLSAGRAPSLTAARDSSNSTAPASSCARSARASMAFYSRNPCASIPGQHLGGGQRLQHGDQIRSAGPHR